MKSNCHGCKKIFEQNNHYYKLKYDNTFPNVKELQQHLTGRTGADQFLYYEEALHVFVYYPNFVYIYPY